MWWWGQRFIFHHCVCVWRGGGGGSCENPPLPHPLIGAYYHYSHVTDLMYDQGSKQKMTGQYIEEKSYVFSLVLPLVGILRP